MLATALKAAAVLTLTGAASAAYGSAGELQGRVIEALKQGDATFFRMEVETQEIYSQDPPLKRHVRLVYAGERQEDIRAGLRLHVWFNEDNGDDDRDGLNVTRIDFPDGTSVFHAKPQALPVEITVPEKLPSQNARPKTLPVNVQQVWWVEPMRTASGLITFFLAAVGLYRYVIKHPRI
jgi:hypothetical protein